MQLSTIDRGAMTLDRTAMQHQTALIGELSAAQALTETAVQH